MTDEELEVIVSKYLDAFYERRIQKLSGLQSEGVDIVIEDDVRYLAIAVKSGPSVFNAQSKRRQNQEFQSLRSRMLKIQKQFDALVGYGYGNKVSPASANKVFRELSGQSFWAELTGDEDFYLRIIRVMRDRPTIHRASFDEAWAAAINRFTLQFIERFCKEDGSIDWELLTKFNSGKREK